MARTQLLTVTVLFFAIVAPTRTARAQCLLANPSFELPGSAGATFAGWNQFGSTGSSTQASHGHVSARVSGPNTGSWAVSGYWQPFNAVPGGRWVGSVRALNSTARPLTGGSQAILNIEWRDAASNLISYESHTVASAGTPTNQWVDYSVQSQPAPAGTAQARLLLGVLQGPSDPVPDVLFDQATFDNAGPPTIDDIQWNDFPGGRTMNFSGRTWRVKGPGYYGPGPNLFCNSASCTWVDTSDQLHLTVQNISGQWYSTEVVLDQALGYGDYVFTTVGRLDQLDPKVVFGLFLWQYGRCYDAGFLWWNPYNEIDIEFSRWGNAADDIAQFVAQPYDYPGNIQRFNASFTTGELTSHAMRWLPDRVEFRSWRGGPLAESPGTLIHSWTYAGPHISRPEQPRVHVNLWQFTGPPSSRQEVVLDEFTFVPAPVVGVPKPSDTSDLHGLTAIAQPNPFGFSTRIRYTLTGDGRAELTIYDAAGRHVRSLVRGEQSTGPHEVVWDGRDEAGREVKPGIYVYRLDAGGTAATGRMVRLR